MSESEGFLTDIDTLCLFARVCRLYRIEDYDKRVALMRKITARHRDKVKYMRDVKPFLMGKNVLQIKNVRPKENE